MKQNNKGNIQDYINQVAKENYLKGYKTGFNEGVKEGYYKGVQDTVNQIKREAHELFKDSKNYGMNFLKHIKSKYPYI